MIQEKIDKILAKFDYLNTLLSQEQATSDIETYVKNTQELAEISGIVSCYNELKKNEKYLEELNQQSNTETDTEMLEMIKEEQKSVSLQIEEQKTQLKNMLIPQDNSESRNILCSIQASAGGDEACLIVEELLGMYSKFAEKNKWKFTIETYTDGSVCGLREVVFTVCGKGAYEAMKFEAGVHRYQRVPVTEKNGRLQTSTVSVSVLPERTETEVQIDERDIKMDVCRSGGAGGQKVNKTSSCVILTHIPTGIVVRSQVERSQLQNKENCLAMLRTKLYDYYNDPQITETAKAKKDQLGSGERAEKIRTYNFQRDSITDHRINYTIYGINKYLQGNMEDMIEHMQISENKAEEF